jgi:sec-independent protein translocase protein TatA
VGSIGTQEIILIFIIALIVFGPRKLPEIGKAIGKGLADFKKASNELRQTWEEEVSLDKEKAALTNALSESTGGLTEIVSDINKSVDGAVSAAVQEESPK